MNATLLLTIAVTLAAMAPIWFLSLKLGDVGIIDIYWGPGFAVIGAAALWATRAASDGDRLIVILAAVWGLRLGLHLLRRWRRQDAEDVRYAAMRRRSGPHFGWTSLFSVFALQAAIMWVVSLPLQFAILSQDRAEPIALPLLGVAMFAFGFAIEAIADWQLARFKRTPGNREKVMTGGLWAWTRHPNYLGDACVWWGLFLLCLAGGAPWWTAIGPAVMTVFLVAISGAPLLERHLLRSKPDYARYVSRTSAFLPWPPKRP